MNLALLGGVAIIYIIILLTLKYENYSLEILQYYLILLIIQVSVKLLSV